MELLSTLDTSVIIGFFAITLIIGLAVSRNAGKSSESFFLSGRSMPWWLLGVSMVATTFSADTPNLVADLVRQNGVSGNWVWWAFLLTGMLTVFFYAKLWRRLGITTDLEFYEIRYSGKPAAFLRGFRALYLGVVFNVFIMAIVCLAAVKIGGVFGFSALQTLTVAGIITVAYSLIGGLKGVIVTDFFQFIIAMVGSIWAAFYIVNLPEVGGMSEMINNPLVSDYTNFFPDFSNPESYIPIFLIPLAVQWWSTWYPGAEPGGGGYIVQRMLSAKDEKNATFATLFFNVAHYALRPWPWLIIALATLIIYPKVYDTDKINQLKVAPDAISIFEKEVSERDFVEAKDIFYSANSNAKNAAIDDVYFYALAKQIKAKTSPGQSNQEKFESVKEFVPLQLAVPNMEASKIGHDLSYPLLIKSLPKGLLGLVLASLIAAFMSTISTHLNWGSSYVVNDLYKRFINKDASDKKLVLIGRISIVLMMIGASFLTLVIEQAKEGFDLLLNIGAGTGLLFILRWFWFRINAIAEIVAMVVSFVLALIILFLEKAGVDLSVLGPWKMVLILAITTISWMLTAVLSKRTDETVLAQFKERAYGIESKSKNIGFKFLGMILAVFGVYTALFAVGSLLYSKNQQGFILLAFSLICWTGIVIGRKRILN